MTRTGSSITKDMTPVEAANLLERLEDGQQAAWLSTHGVPWHSAEYQFRFQNAADVDSVFRDLMWETLENDMRRPGEPVEQFAERAASQATFSDTRNADAKAADDPIARLADDGTMPQRGRDRGDETATRLLDDPSTPEGQAYARTFSDTFAAHVKELRERDPLPEPDRTSGAPHPDPFLASRGWHVNQHGIYIRQPELHAAGRPEKELEAG